MSAPPTSAPAEDRATDRPASAQPPSNRLVASQLRRIRRIVDAAVELAEVGGFDAVRLRDVAERSEVALGTLYKYFRSKEDLLLFAFNEELGRLEQVLAARPVSGPDALARVSELFARATRGLMRRPQTARAMIRASAGGDEDTALKIANSRLRVARLIIAAIRDDALVLDAPLGMPTDAQEGDARDAAVADALVGVWFSLLVGWSAGLQDEPHIIQQVRSAAQLMLES